MLVSIVLTAGSGTHPPPSTNALKPVYELPYNPRAEQTACASEHGPPSERDDHAGYALLLQSSVRSFCIQSFFWPVAWTITIAGASVSVRGLPWLYALTHGKQDVLLTPNDMMCSSKQACMHQACCHSGHLVDTQLPSSALLWEGPAHRVSQQSWQYLPAACLLASIQQSGRCCTWSLLSWLACSTSSDVYQPTS